MNFSLNIQVVPHGDNADLFINGRYYPLNTATLNSPGDLRDYLCNEPDYIFDAVMGLLREAVTVAAR